MSETINCDLYEQMYFLNFGFKFISHELNETIYIPYRSISGLVLKPNKLNIYCNNKELSLFLESKNMVDIKNIYEELFKNIK